MSRIGGLTDYCDEIVDFEIKDTLLFAATGSTGLHIFNIADSHHPIDISQYDPRNAVFEVALVGHYAFIVDNHSLLHVLDILNPFRPVEVGTPVATEIGGRDLTISGDKAFACTNHGISIIDVSNPETPVVIENAIEIDRAQNLDVRDSLVFVVSETDGLFIFNAANSASPTMYMQWPLAGRLNDVKLWQNYALIAAEDSGLLVVDVSDPFAPMNVASYQFDLARQIDVTGTKAILAGNGLAILDLSIPALPVQVQDFTVGTTRNLFVDGSTFYFVNFEGFNTFISDSIGSFFRADTYTPRRFVHAVAIKDSFAFLAENTKGIRSVDISNPVAPVELSSVGSYSQSWDICIAGNTAYVADYSALRVIDITNPRELVELQSVQLSSNVYTVAVSGNYLYAGGNFPSLSILDISNPENPDLITRFQLTAVDDIDIEGNYAFVIGDQKLFIIDVSNPSVPELISEYNAAYYPAALDVQGNYAYIANWSAGFFIIDVTDVHNPVEVSAIDSLAYANSVTVAGNFAFVSRNNGISIVDISNPVAPQVVGHYVGARTADGCNIQNGFAFVAERNYFTIYDVSDAFHPEDNHVLPTQFSLHPIYPNPFNNTANISFDLPREVTGRLVVYDVLGRMTNTLYDGKLAAGSHSMQFNGNNLSSGTYFVKLETPDFNAVQKAVLLK